MRLEGDQAGQAMGEAWVGLTKSEAGRLLEVLSFMVGVEGDTDPESHAHVVSDDGAVEITVGWDRTDPTP